MRMNSRMSELLDHAGISFPLDASPSRESFPPETFIVVDDSLLLKEQYEKNGNIQKRDFPDAVGFESFINHIHLPYNDNQDSLKVCLLKASELLAGLKNHDKGRRFIVIVSFSADGCVVRFHQRRPNQTWLADNLEKYSVEAILEADSSHDRL